MSAHFWLSKEAIPLTLDELSSMSDDQARQFLAEMRWGCADKQVCPDCGVVDYVHEAVNHSEEFSRDDGVNENQAESFFSRMRRSCFGIYHRITPKYMLDYACEMAWREDMRRKNTKQQIRSLFQRVCSAGVSADWFNYSHGHKRAAEIMFQASPSSPA